MSLGFEEDIRRKNMEMLVFMGFVADDDSYADIAHAIDDDYDMFLDIIFVGQRQAFEPALSKRIMDVNQIWFQALHPLSIPEVIDNGKFSFGDNPPDNIIGIMRETGLSVGILPMLDALANGVPLEDIVA